MCSALEAIMLVSMNELNYCLCCFFLEDEDQININIKEEISKQTLKEFFS